MCWCLVWFEFGCFEAERNEEKWNGTNDRLNSDEFVCLFTGFKIHLSIFFEAHLCSGQRDDCFTNLLTMLLLFCFPNISFFFWFAFSFSLSLFFQFRFSFCFHTMTTSASTEHSSYEMKCEKSNRTPFVYSALVSVSKESCLSLSKQNTFEEIVSLVFVFEFTSVGLSCVYLYLCLRFHLCLCLCINFTRFYSGWQSDFQCLCWFSWCHYCLTIFETTFLRIFDQFCPQCNAMQCNWMRMGSSSDRHVHEWHKCTTKFNGHSTKP